MPTVLAGMRMVRLGRELAAINVALSALRAPKEDRD